MMIANRLVPILFLTTVIYGCSPMVKENQSNHVTDLLNLTIQVIHSELNIWNCYRKESSPDGECETGFNYLADSLIIVNEIFDISTPENKTVSDCYRLQVDPSCWQKITYYKSINLSALDLINLGRKDYSTKYFLIHQPWVCDEKVFINVSMHGYKIFSGHLLIFKKNTTGRYELDEIELMGYS